MCFKRTRLIFDVRDFRTHPRSQQIERMKAISSNLSSLQMNIRKPVTSEGFYDRAFKIAFQRVIHTEANGDHMEVTGTRVD